MASQMMMGAAGGPTAGYPSNNPRGSSGGATFTSQDISRFGNLSLGESSAAESVAGGQQQRKREKFDKKDFTNPNRASGLDKAKQDASDPFSSLDPLWNMKQQ